MQELKKHIMELDIASCVPNLLARKITFPLTDDIIVYIGSKDDCPFFKENSSITLKDAKAFSSNLQITKKIADNKEIYCVNVDDKPLSNQAIIKLCQALSKKLTPNKEQSVNLILGNKFFSNLCSLDGFIGYFLYSLPFKDSRFKSDAKGFTPAFKAITISYDNDLPKNKTLNLEAISTIYVNTLYVRLLANTPSNIATPHFFAKEAKLLAKELKVNVDILNTKALEEENCQAYLAVAKGSKNPPYMSVLSYEGNPDSNEKVVLVGKGLTFDSGGICLKPSANMDEMIFDKCGASCVLGVFKTCCELKLKVNLSVILACAENLPDGNAYKPGDILKTRKGLTVEVQNTDAEGRLVLCDALDYAKRLKPTKLIDIATLTGACCIALGNIYSGLFSNDEDLLAKLLTASKESNDLAWAMPLGELYKDNITPNFADISNSGPRYGGASHAAEFLAQFTTNIPWAHLDIAATAWQSNDRKGATARPLPLLVAFLQNLAK